MTSNLTTPSSLLFHYIDPSMLVHRVIRPSILLGLVAIEGLASIERVSLSSLSAVSRVFSNIRQLSAFGQYCEHLKSESYEIHAKILTVFRASFPLHRPFILKPGYSFDKLYDAFKRISGQKNFHEEAKKLLTIYFSQSLEEDSLDLIRLNPEGVTKLELLVRQANDLEHTPLKTHFLSACIDYSDESIDFLKGMLFQLFRFEIKQIVPHSLSLQLNRLLGSKFDGLKNRYYWMERILDLHPELARATFKDEFQGFVKKICDGDPSKCLIAVNDPNSFFHPNDIKSWISDKRISNWNLRTIFSYYILDPSKYDLLISSFDKIDFDSTDRLFDLLVLAKIITKVSYEGNDYSVSGDSVLAYFLRTHQIDYIFTLLNQILMLAKAQVGEKQKDFFDAFHQTLSLKFYYNGLTNQLTCGGNGCEGVLITVMEYLLMKEGTRFFLFLQSACSKFKLKPEIWRRYIDAILGSSFYNFFVININDPDSYMFSKRRDIAAETFRTRLHPLFLIALAPEEKIDWRFLEDFIFSYCRKPLALEWGCFNPFTGFTNLFADQPIYKWLHDSVVFGFDMDILGFKDLDELLKMKKHIIDKIIENRSEELFLAWEQFLKHSTIIACEFRIGAHRVSNELFMVPAILHAFKNHPFGKQLESMAANHFLINSQMTPSNLYEECVKSFFTKNMELEFGNFDAYFDSADSSFHIIETCVEIFRVRKDLSRSLKEMELEKKCRNTLKGLFPDLSYEKQSLIIELLNDTLPKLMNSTTDQLDNLILLIHRHQSILKRISSDELLINYVGFQKIFDVIIKKRILDETFEFQGLRNIIYQTSIEEINNHSFPDCQIKEMVLDFFYACEAIERLEKAGESSYKISEEKEIEIPEEILDARRNYFRICSIFAAVQTNFNLWENGDTSVVFDAGNVSGLLQSLKNYFPNNFDLIRPFYRFSGSSETNGLKNLKQSVKSKFNSLKSGQSGEPDALKRALTELFSQIETLLIYNDPLDLKQFLKIFSQIEFLSIEAAVEEKSVPYVVAETILDDDGSPLTKEMLSDNFERFIKTIVFRKDFLAVPANQEEKIQFYELLECNLYRLKRLLIQEIEAKKQLDLIGPLICNLALAMNHCATRWSLEIENIYDALRSQHPLKKFNQILEKKLHLERKQIVMRLLETMYSEEIEVYGLEFIIHRLNYLKSEYYKELGLPPSFEDLLGDDLVGELEEKIEDLRLFFQIDQALIKQVIKNAAVLPQLEDALVRFCIIKVQKDTFIPYLPLPSFNIDTLFEDLNPIVKNMVKKLQKSSFKDLSKEKQTEYQLLVSILRSFHSELTQSKLLERGLMSKKALKKVLNSIGSKPLPDFLANAFNRLQGVISDDEVKRALQEFVAPKQDSIEYQVFEEAILENQFVRSKFVAWLNNRKSTSNELESTYYSTILMTLLRLVYRSTLENKTLIQESIGILSKFDGDPWLRTFICEQMALPQFSNDVERAIMHLAHLEASNELALKFQSFGVSAVSMNHAANFLYKAISCDKEERDALLKNLIERAINEMFKEKILEAFMKRPVIKYLTMIQKLVEENYLIHSNPELFSTGFTPYRDLFSTST